MIFPRWMKYVVFLGGLSLPLMAEPAPNSSLESKLVPHQKPRMVIIDPGHEEHGADSGEPKAARLLGEALAKELERDGRFQSFTTRDDRGYNRIVTAFSKSLQDRIRQHRRDYARAYGATMRSSAYFDLLIARAGIANQEWSKDVKLPLFVEADAFLSLHYNESGTKYWRGSSKGGGQGKGGSRRKGAWKGVSGKPQYPAGWYDPAHGFCLYIPKENPKVQTLHPAHAGKRIEESRSLAQRIVSELKDMNFRPSTVRHESSGIAQAQFCVLRPACAPSILIENGFIYNPLDRYDAFNPASVKHKAQAIYRGLCKYFGMKPKE